MKCGHTCKFLVIQLDIKENQPQRRQEPTSGSPDFHQVRDEHPGERLTQNNEEDRLKPVALGEILNQSLQEMLDTPRRHGHC